MIRPPTLDELIELAQRAPAPPGQVLSGASDEELYGLGSLVGRSLPAGLRQWLRVVNGAMLGPGGVFGIRPRRDYLSIQKYLRIYPEWASLGWIPVASDGVGNYWVIVPCGPDGSPDWVAFVDIESNPASVDRYVASDFMRFMRFLLEAELGESRWPSDRDYDLERDPKLGIAPEELAAWVRR
jgi:hypothetical protein